MNSDENKVGLFPELFEAIVELAEEVEENVGVTRV